MPRFKHIFKLLIFLASGFPCCSLAQTPDHFAGDILKTHHIPAIAYAVVTDDSILAMEAIGEARIGSGNRITLKSRFHIGSNTKAITSLIAAGLVEQGLLQWNTDFFDLFPELRENSSLKHISLSDLLDFKVPLAPFTYSTSIPPIVDTYATDFQQRYQLVSYLLQQQPVRQSEGLYLTNTGYILAGLMLEKASKQTYKNLVRDLGKQFSIDFQFGSPAISDTNQTYGHDEQSNPVTAENIKLSWLLSAGNINNSLPNYARLIQQYLLALEARPTLCSQQLTQRLGSDNSAFCLGWFRTIEPRTRNHILRNDGNANGFMSGVLIIKEKGIAFIVLANQSSEKTEAGIEAILFKLRNKYSTR